MSSEPILAAADDRPTRPVEGLTNTVNVDIGGTFTDCFVSYEGRQASGKQATTRYRLTHGFNAAIEEAAGKLGVDVEELLGATDIVRYATTLAMNALIERKGPKLGLITTAGFEDTVFIGRGAQWHDGLPMERKREVARGRRPVPIIPREMIVGVRERISSDGDVIIPLSEDDVRRGLRQLVDRGAQGFIVALNWGHVNPKHEEMVRDLIREEFPDIFLGAQPVLLASEVAPRRNEYQRSMTAILSGYLHRTFAEELTELSAVLRERGYRHPLFVANNAGGVNPLERTTAVQTYNAGPVGAVIGGEHIARQYGYPNAIMTDMGGTSFDISTVVDVDKAAADGGHHFYSHMPMIDRFRVAISMIETRSIGAGGGSIARYNDLLNILEVGPESAGSNPGPACFDLGGELPTVTDADLVLGYINPDYFLGGQMPLNAEAAHEAVRRHLAEPLGVSPEEAAFAVRRIVDGNMGNEIYKETNLKGFDPQEFRLFGLGGAGPTHACGYGSHVETKQIYTFPFASVFSAYGIANSDFRRAYEQSQKLMLWSPSEREWLWDPEEFNVIVRGLQEEALRDAEDLGTDRVEFTLELEMRFGLQPHTTRIVSPRMFIDGDEDCEEIYRAFEREYSRIFSKAATYLKGGVEILSFILWSVIRTQRIALPTFDLVGADPSAARKGSRPTFWGEERGWVDTPVYDLESLQPGNHLEGPAVVEAPDTTVLVDPGWELEIDQHRNAVIERVAQ